MSFENKDMKRDIDNVPPATSGPSVEDRVKKYVAETLGIEEAWDDPIGQLIYSHNQQRQVLQKWNNPPSLTGDAEIDHLLRECIKTLATRGAEYTVGSPDRLANFRGASEDADIPMEKVWYVLFNKQYRAVQSYVKNGCQVSSNEPIDSRIMDCIVYLLLFQKMTLEIERSRAPKQTAQDKLALDMTTLGAEAYWSSLNTGRKG